MTSRMLSRCTLLLFFMAGSALFAQAPAADATAASAATRRSVVYGVRFGPAFTTLTSVETFDDTVVAAAPEPTMHFGGFATIGISGPLSFQPELLFAAKGHRIHHRDAQPTISGTGTKAPAADRVILIRYLEIPLLLRASNQTGQDSSVYLIAGPSYAIRRNAVIRQVADSGKREEITEQVTGNNLSVVFGGGLQRGRWLVDARVTRGLRSVAATPEPGDVKTGGFAVLMGVGF